MKTAIIIGVIIAIAAGMYYYSTIVQVPNSENVAIPPKAPLTQTDGHSTITTQGETIPAKPSETDLSLQELFKKVENSVVQITIRTQKGFGGEGLGSGFIYDQDGHIVTNFHVVQDASRIDVTFLDGTVYRATTVGTDPYADLAVIHVDVPKDKLLPLPLADSSKLQVGDQVAAIGNPFGLSGSMTTGIVSQLGRLLPASDTNFSIPDVIQTDAAINPGNSGGPLLNMKGEVIGVNSAIRSSTGEFSGIGFSIPANTVKKIVPALIKDGSYKHSWLGISGSDVTPEIADTLHLKEAKGFLIVDVVANSPAAKSGIKGGDKVVTLDGRQIRLGGDVIIRIDNTDVRKIDDVLIYLDREKSVDDKVQLTVIRNGETMEIPLVLGERPSPFESP